MEENNKKGEEFKSKNWLWWLVVLILAGLVVSASVLTLLSYFEHSKPSGVPSHPGPIVAKYAHALDIAMKFFDVQKCTKSPLRIHGTQTSLFTSNLNFFVLFWFLVQRVSWWRIGFHGEAIRGYKTGAM